jgi:hypothetical protein
MNEALDLKRHFDVAPAIEALAGAAFCGLELWKLRLPEPQNVRLDFADACNVADLKIETVWDRGLFLDALGG